MYFFVNKTTKEQFERFVKENSTVVEFEKDVSKVQKAWKISDKYGNKTFVIFTGKTGEFTIINKKEDFLVNVYFHGSSVEIRSAVCKGRNNTSERFLKKYNRLAMVVHCCVLYGYIKL